MRAHAIRGFVPLALLALVLCVPSRASAAGEALNIAFDGDTVVATGITRGGKVAWFGVGHAHEQAALHVISRHGFVTDEDGNGEVRFDVGREVPLHSVWIAVDLESGEFAVASPEGHVLRRLPLTGNAIHPGAAGAAEVFEDAHPLLQVVVVRPRSGAAWRADVGDGGTHDEDGQGNGRLRLSLATLVPFEGSPELRPAVLTAGDVFAAIALDSLETYAEKLPLGGGQH